MTGPDARRRELIKALLVTGGSLAAAPGLIACAGAPTPAAEPIVTSRSRENSMAFTLPALPYDPSALEPHIDTQTMQIHHGKHHQAYVNNLNAAIEKAPELANKSLDDLMRGIDRAPDAVKTAVRNNGGGHWNHSMFWQIMAPKGGGEPGGAVGEAIRKSFGDFAKMREQFNQAATTRFGSGWAWLVRDGDKLTITSTPNQDNPLMEGKHAVLGLDVWEHAYYLKYQNRRPDYIQAWWNVVNWPEVEKRYGSAGR